MKKIIFILLSILGISATFMPWIYIPIASKGLYGYIGDGLITAFLFLVGLIIFTIQRNQFDFSRRVKFSLIGIYSILVLIAFFKIYKFNFNRDNYDEVNFMISNALAGAKLGVGVYVLAFASLSLLVITFVFSRNQASKPFHISMPFKVGGAIAILSLLFWSLFLNRPDLNKKNIELSMKNEFNEMQLAFQANDMDKFLTYIHPITVGPLGEENFKNAIQVARNYLYNQGLSIKAVYMDSIIHTEKNFNNIQSIALNRIIFSGPSGDSTSVQRTLCISEDGGNKWYYFNTTGQSFQDLKNGFPNINENLSKYISK